MGFKQAAIKRHLTEHTEECEKIKQKITGNTRNIKARSLWLLVGTQNHMFITSRQLMAMALPEWSINANSRILVKPRMMEDLPVLNLIMMGYKFPPSILRQNYQNHPQMCMIMPLTQKGDLQCFPTSTFETNILIPFLSYFPFLVHTCCRWIIVVRVALKGWDICLYYSYYDL